MFWFAILLLCGALLMFFLNAKKEKEIHQRRLKKIQSRLAEIEKEKQQKEQENEKQE